MKPPLISPGPRPVSLKSSVPSSLHAAFSEDQWFNAANLAKQRHRITKDPYYLAVEVAAKSQSDIVADRNAGKVLVESMIKDNVAVTDADTLDLLELSCSRENVKYSETIGLLRAKLVKAIPKDMNSCLRSFEACVYHSDWKNAQLIAASLSKNFSNDRKFLFHYLLATHLYAQSDDCPEGSKKIFSSLARAQADKAYDFRTMTAGTNYHINRAVLTESEAMLWLTIRIEHCTREENLTLFKKPEYGPLAFLEVGFSRPYSLALRYLAHMNAWDDLFQVGKSILEHAIRKSQEEALVIEADETVINLRKAIKAESEQDPVPEKSSLKKDLNEAIAKIRPHRELKDHHFFIASCEWDLFSFLFEAARNSTDKRRSLKQAQQLFHKMIKALTRAESMKPIFQRNYELVTMQILFERESRLSSGDDAGDDSSPKRIIHLTEHVMKHAKEFQSFVDTQEFIKQMSEAEVSVFLNTLRAKAVQCDDFFERLTLTSLTLKLRYHVTTSSHLSCDSCHAMLDGPNCDACLKSIAVNALNAYKSSMEDKNLRENILPHENVEPLSDIAVTGAVCLLRLAGLGKMKVANSPLYHINIPLFLQAVLWLDSHLTLSPPRNDRHRMLLVKLYLLMGCVFRAKNLWDNFDVKNAILDSLGLLYLDRLSSIDPGIFFSSSSREDPVDPFSLHYTKAFRNTFPKWIMNSLEQNNYASTLDMIDRQEKQATSCTLVTTVLEERRGIRMKTGKNDTSIDDHPFVRNFSIDMELKDVTDYGILSGGTGDEFEPDLDGKSSKPLHMIVNYGPLPSHTRSHLGLLAERFLDFACYVQPKEYKPSKAGQILQLDLQYAIATCSHIKNDMQTLLGLTDAKLSEEEKAKFAHQRERAQASLTGPEANYHVIVWRLLGLIVSILEGKTDSTTANELRDRIRSQIEELTEALDDQAGQFSTVLANVPSKIHGFHGFGALHAMGMLRESALAVRHTATYLTAVSEKLKNADKTRSSSEMAWLAPELKKMTAAAVKSETAIKTRIQLLKKLLDDVDGWRDRLCDWTFGEYVTPYERDREFKREMSDTLKEIVPKANYEMWADQVGESWRQLMKGWAAIKFD